MNRALKDYRARGAALRRVFLLFDVKDPHLQKAIRMVLHGGCKDGDNATVDINEAIDNLRQWKWKYKG